MSCIVLLKLPLDAEEESKRDFTTCCCRTDGNVAQPLGVLGAAGTSNVTEEVLLVGICELCGCAVVNLGKDEGSKVRGVVD